MTVHKGAMPEGFVVTPGGRRAAEFVHEVAPGAVVHVAEGRMRHVTKGGRVAARRRAGAAARGGRPADAGERRPSSGTVARLRDRLDHLRQLPERHPAEVVPHYVGGAGRSADAKRAAPVHVQWPAEQFDDPAARAAVGGQWRVRRRSLVCGELVCRRPGRRGLLQLAGDGQCRRHAGRADDARRDMAGSWAGSRWPAVDVRVRRDRRQQAVDLHARRAAGLRADARVLLDQPRVGLSQLDRTRMRAIAITDADGTLPRWAGARSTKSPTAASTR